MKTKITPQEYSTILTSLDLYKISLTNASLKVSPNLPNGANVDLDFKDKYKFLDEKESVKFFASFVLEGSIGENDTKSKLFIISGEYQITYNKLNEVVVTRDFFEIFKEMSLTTIIWPYFREYIQNMVTRAGLPPFVLPSKIIMRNKD